TRPGTSTTSTWPTARCSPPRPTRTRPSPSWRCPCARPSTSPIASRSGSCEMSTELPELVHVDRRITLKWLAGALAVGQLAACGDGAKGITWPEVAAIKAKGYGTDPDL